MKPDFWHIQLHSTTKLPVEILHKILTEKQQIGLAEAWQNKKGDWAKDPDLFRNKMQVGDIVLVRSGRQPIALTQVTSDAFITEKNNPKEDWFELRRNIKVLAFYDDQAQKLMKNALKTYDKKYIQALGTLTFCAKESATKKFVEDWWVGIH